MYEKGQLSQPSCAADALLMLQGALGYLAECDGPDLQAAGQAQVLAALDRAGVAQAAARARLQPAPATAAPSVDAQPAGAAGWLRDFGQGGPLDTAPASPELIAVADTVTGPDGRCPGASDDQLYGLVRFWDRAESWTASRKLASIAEVIRHQPAPGCAPQGPAQMPRVWDEFTADELAAALSRPGQGADKLLTLAHVLAVRLPNVLQALADGRIDAYKAQIIADATSVLSDADAARAADMILNGIEGKTPGQLRNLIARAVITLDPGAAKKRREAAQREARVRLWREDAGTAALCGSGLPADEALAADQQITALARELRAAGLDGTMDQLRVRAYLDRLLVKDSRPAPGTDPPAEPGPAGPDQPAAAPRDHTGPDQPGGGPSAGRTGQHFSGGFATRINLTIPLATLLGLAERPGEAHGLGAIDPDLARTMAEAAGRNPRTTWCVTVTDDQGHPTAHGCARPTRRDSRNGGTGGPGPPGSGAGNRDGPAFTREQDHGPPGPDGQGRWRLTTPGPSGRDHVVDIKPLPVTDCDHRHETAGYEPSDRLRHLVEIRDGECTFPPCRRQATASDFEHAVPYDQGGRTCACNAGARCRHHHRAKQAPGWRVDQHQPGYHTWTTPSGRQYTSGPTAYPV